MAPDDIDQDKLAAEWAAALDEQEDEKPASQTDIDALFDQPSAAPKAGAAEAKEDDALASEWASALADEEEQSIKKERDQESLSRQSAAAQFKNLTHAADPDHALRQQIEQQISDKPRAFRQKRCLLAVEIIITFAPRGQGHLAGAIGFFKKQAGQTATHGR